MKKLLKTFLVSTVAYGISGFGMSYAQQAVPLLPPSGSPTTPVIEEETQSIRGPVLRGLRIEGLQRIEEETLVTYLSIEPGKPYNAILVNDSIKNLYATGLFADVSIIDLGQNRLSVKVIENPIINRVAFEGNLRITDEILTSETQLRPRVVYTRTRVQNDVKRILDIYRRRGRYAAKVEPKVIQLEQNRVDLAYEIEEGPDSGVHDISFVGNEFFDDSDLQDELLTRQTRWYSFLSNADKYDPDKLTFDRELLRRYYLSNGFADFRVASAVAELSEDKTGFFITFTLSEGQRYKFGDFEIKSSIPGIDFDTLKAVNDIEIGEWYNNKLVDDVVLKMVDQLNLSGFPFVDIYPNIERDQENGIVSVTFEINESEKVYVDRIDIRGNVRTKDHVIRREIALIEGDAFNSSKLRRSKERIQGLGYFKDVKVENVPAGKDGYSTVEVEVEEQSTGDISFGGGFSTGSGALARVALNERNILGTGRHLRISTSVAQEGTDVDFSITDPYFLDRKLTAGFDIFFKEEDNQDTSSSDTKEQGIGLRTGFKYDRFWSQGLSLRVAKEELTNVKDTASIYVKAEEGEKSVISISQNLSYNKLNRNSKPSEGYRLGLSNEYAGLFGDVNYFLTRLSGSHYTSFSDEDYILELNASVSNIIGLNGDDVRLNDRLYGGGANLRGFDSAGVGPRDTSTSDAIGGTKAWFSSAELQFPTGTPDEFGLKGAVFVDAGSVWDTESSGINIADDDSIRASIGIGLDWDSPLGPMRFTLARPILDENYDEEQVFRFDFGTAF